MKKIVCTHLYNDFSGSPLILSTVIKGFIQKGIKVDLLTSISEEGFLSGLSVNYIDNKYTFAENKFLRIFYFFFTQLLCFCKMWRYRKEDVVIYVNTLLPFGIALAGKMMNKKVVYHIHETSVKPIILKRLLKWVAAKTATEIIYVSDFLRKEEPIGSVPSTIVYNALSNEFISAAKKYKKEKIPNQAFTILMLCSLKDYKGVWEFVTIAKALPELSFELVLNADKENIEEFFRNKKLTQNLQLFPKQNNVHPFYQRANIVINLSHPEQWIETFGMTLLEGMEYGIPAISPPVGGCTEFVKHGVNGYQTDQRKTEVIVQQINQLYRDQKLYQQFSNNANHTAQQFNVSQMCQQVLMVVS